MRLSFSARARVIECLQVPVAGSSHSPSQLKKAWHALSLLELASRNMRNLPTTMYTELISCFRKAVAHFAPRPGMCVLLLTDDVRSGNVKLEEW